MLQGMCGPLPDVFLIFGRYSSGYCYIEVHLRMTTAIIALLSTDRLQGNHSFNTDVLQLGQACLVIVHLVC